MESSIKELAYYRLDRAKEMIADAEYNFKSDRLKTSLNRSYYGVFHAMRAVNITEGFDSSKHSGVIAYFNLNFLKTGKLDKSLSAIIKETSLLREKSDYDDFYIAGREETEKQLSNAKIFISKVEEYLKEQ